MPSTEPFERGLSTDQRNAAAHRRMLTQTQTMHLEEALNACNGIARVAQLRELGIRSSEIRKALEAKRVVRPSPGWIASAQADPELIGAAYRSVVLTCVTEARRLGLWVLAEPERHVAARTPHSRLKPGSFVVHWGKPVVARVPWALVDPIENVLAYVAECQPYEAARAVWESALNKQLVTLDQLRALPLRPRARKIMHDSTPFSDSGLETFVSVRLRWLKASVIAQAWILGHRVDFLIGSRLVLQIDGRDHVGAQRTKDNRHDTILALNGYTVIRVGYEQVVHDWPEVQQQLMTAIAQDLHIARAEKRG